MNLLVLFLCSIIILPEPILSKYRFFIWTVLGGAFVFSCARNFKRSYFVDSYPDIIFLFYILSLSLSFYFAINREVALPAYIRFLIPPIFIYYIFKNESRFLNKEVFACIFIFLGSVVSMLAISEFITHKNFIYEYLIDNPWYKMYIASRAMATFMMPAVLGTYLLVCISMLFYIIYNTGRRYKRYLSCVAFILCFIAMLLTFSRGTLIGFTAMSVFYFYKKYKNHVVFLIVFLLLFAIILIGSSPFLHDINLRLSWKGVTSDYIYTYKASRAITTAKMLKDHPFFGVGPDNYRHVFDKYHFVKGIPHEKKIPDNMFMMISGELGLLGLVTFMAFLIGLFKKALLYFNANTNKKDKSFVLSVMAGLLGIVFNMLTYDLLYWQMPFYLFWVFIGILAAFGQREVRAAK